MLHCCQLDTAQLLSIICYQPYQPWMESKWAGTSGWSLTLCKWHQEKMVWAWLALNSSFCFFVTTTLFYPVAMVFNERDLLIASYTRKKPTASCRGSCLIHTVKFQERSLIYFVCIKMESYHNKIATLQRQLFSNFDKDVCPWYSYQIYNWIESLIVM